MHGDSTNTQTVEKPLSHEAMIECLLFVAGDPVPIDAISKVLELAHEEVQAALDHLDIQYAQRGIRLQRKGQRFQLVTAPEAAPYVRTFLGLEASSRLSPAALEALAIVAYLQPITRAQIESIRGVSSDSVLRTLVNRGLLEEQGRLDQVGRPKLYGTSFEFLQQFGLTSAEQLPPLEPAAE